MEIRRATKRMFRWTWALAFVAMAFTMWLPGQALAGDIISGAGATFPYPIYAKWAHDYAQKTGIQLNYQSIGSGGGIQQIKAKTVDFGASDAPLKAEDLNASGLIQWPMIMGGVCPVVNLKGIKANELRLDGETVAKIFLGEITKWNDPAIQAQNPGIQLPGDSITVVHRSDGSGTTWIFTHYLKAVSPAWGEKVGADKAVNWPVGLGGKGNEGVAAYVKRVRGAFGYVEYAYAKQNHLATVMLKNKDGNYVAPTSEAFQAAAAGADWVNTPGMAVILVDQPGAQSWPITGASFILFYKDQANADTAKRVLTFFDWAYRNGAQMAMDLDYVPIPKAVYDIVEAMWTKDIQSGGAPIWSAK